MDVSVIYVPEAVDTLSEAISQHDHYSPVADIRDSLSAISFAMDNGYEFSASIEMVPVVTAAGHGAWRQFWVKVCKRPDGGYRILVPNANWAGGVFELLADVSESRKAWKIPQVKLAGRPLER